MTIDTLDAVNIYLITGQQLTCQCIVGARSTTNVQIVVCSNNTGSHGLTHRFIRSGTIGIIIGILQSDPTQRALTPVFTIDIGNTDQINLITQVQLSCQVRIYSSTCTYIDICIGNSHLRQRLRSNGLGRNRATQLHPVAGVQLAPFHTGSIHIILHHSNGITLLQCSHNLRRCLGFTIYIQIGEIGCGPGIVYTNTNDIAILIHFSVATLPVGVQSLAVDTLIQHGDPSAAIDRGIPTQEAIALLDSIGLNGNQFIGIVALHSILCQRSLHTATGIKNNIVIVIRRSQCICTIQIHCSLA